MSIHPNAPTYIATRDHPTEGQLIKIGCSINAVKRCRSLGARIIACGLPHAFEAQLKRALQPWRVWARDGSGRWLRRTEPVFEAPSEWFYLDDLALRAIASITDPETRS